MITRRSFLATAGALLGTAACGGGGRGAQAAADSAALPKSRRLDRVGIQLYTVRRDVARDLPGTLAALAGIGYREVEFAGYFGRKPAEIRSLLAANGLTAPSTHIEYGLIASGWDRALDAAAEIGHRYVTIPWLAPELRKSVSSWTAVAHAFNRAASEARARGLSFAYHNHDFEFVRVEERIPFDLLLSETDPALVHFQLDVYWTVKAGGDPIAYLRAHPGRFPMLHIKDSSGGPAHTQVDVGAGTIDFAAIFRHAAEQGKPIAHAFVEHDDPADPMQFAKRSFDHMKTLAF